MDYSIMTDLVHGVRELCLNSAQPSYGEHCWQSFQHVQVCIFLWFHSVSTFTNKTQL